MLSPDQCVVDVIIELGQEVLGPPRAKVSPDQPNSLRGHTATRRRRYVHSLVQKIDTGCRVTQTQSRQGQVRADDASLDRIPRCLQRAQRAVQAAVCVRGVACVESIETFKSVQAVGVESVMRIVISQLVDRLPGSVECCCRLVGLARPSTDLSVDGVRTSSNGVAAALIAVRAIFRAASGSLVACRVTIV
jgi:hypothetical protein